MILITPETGDEPEESCCGSTDDSKVNSTTATRMPASQPSRKPTLVALALGDSSIKIAAMIGIGLIAIPTANGKISPMTEPMFASLPVRPVATPLAATAEGRQY
jgi:hypothetical protein